MSEAVLSELTIGASIPEVIVINGEPFVRRGPASDKPSLQIAYWKGAYERMAARNIELERQLEELRK